MENSVKVSEETIFFVRVGDMFVSGYSQGESFSLGASERDALLIDYQTVNTVDGKERNPSIHNHGAEAEARNMAKDIKSMLSGLDTNVSVGKKVVTYTTDVKYVDDIDAETGGSAE